MNEAASAYWSAVVATIPVLALALVLEVRRSASKWPERLLIARMVGATASVLYALALLIVFVVSLGSLARGANADAAIWVNQLLVLALFIAVAAPLFDVATRGAGDVWSAAHRRMPWSHIARQRRRWLRHKRHGDELMVLVLEALERAESVLEEARQQHQQQVRDGIDLRMEAAGEVSAILSKAMADPRHENSARMGQKFLERSLAAIEDTSEIEAIIGRLESVREEAFDRLTQLVDELVAEDATWITEMSDTVRRDSEEALAALRQAQEEWSRTL